MSPALVLDGLILALLLAVLALGLRLYLKLRDLRQDTQSFERFRDGLQGATERAETALHDLKRTAADAGEQLNAELGRARGMADELRMLADRADRLAERLADAIDKGRPLERGGTEPRRGRDAADGRAGDGSGRPPRSPRELERALRTLR